MSTGVVRHKVDASAAEPLPTVARPRPSTTLYTAPSVWRAAFERKPLGSNCRNVAIVGIGAPPVWGFT